MNGIYHKIGIHAGALEVIQALTTKKGLASWWTRQVEGPFSNGSSAPGESIRFDFDKGSFEMKVKELAPARVLWECVSGPEDWIGSHVDFSLSQSASPDGKAMTLVHFRHQDWKRESEFTAHCSMKWATFLLSLKNFMEVGEGRPAPDDLKIDDMN
ncbi:SRPBCC domain-containing protein [Leptospira gomenensis]|uniref:SRPBCC domain-containing protein n=1 Tax=Leptospira gomenensis TaxID=2484974 RepID=A0A5F1Y7T5_9LEPT|nr:SRPBCC domain-containing protein [Leptospira gomenensis]TGK30998.1 SRPBCC domain-containing protein [Leptospira gomenensis]TGK35621.1 SRPBCC domain-containing protein [Leptospira gomenensis]TGK45282.1 SRPBCC domain-containing protein [Leptospira gomenensis]TGK66196.1 SRPBCC domain-containing protein [Leptospira gomenensis]